MKEEAIINTKHKNNDLQEIKRGYLEIEVDEDTERFCYNCLSCMVRVADWTQGLKRCLVRSCHYKRCPLNIFPNFDAFVSKAEEWYADRFDTGVGGARMAKIFALSQYRMFIGDPLETTDLYMEFDAINRS